jgi:hypothetical protein
VTSDPGATEQTWIVTVAPGTSLESVATELRRTGLQVDQVLDAVGTVVARGTETLARKASRIPGVTDVSKDLSFDIGPPDAKIS